MTPEYDGHPGPQSPDRVFRELLGLIDRFGWAVRHVGEGKGEPAFSYTVGLTAMGHPEVIVVGLPSDAAQGFLNLVGSLVRDGERFPAGLKTTELADGDAPVVFIEALDTSGLTAAQQVYGQIEAVQLVWPDSAGHLPWVDDYNNSPASQPLLGPPPTSG